LRWGSRSKKQRGEHGDLPGYGQIRPHPQKPSREPPRGRTKKPQRGEEKGKELAKKKKNKGDRRGKLN